MYTQTLSFVERFGWQKLAAGPYFPLAVPLSLSPAGAMPYCVPRGIVSGGRKLHVRGDAIN